MNRFRIWIREWLGLYESIDYLNREIQGVRRVHQSLDQSLRNIYEKLNQPFQELANPQQVKEFILAEKTNREHLVGRVQELESWAFNLQNAGWLRREMKFLGVELPR